MRTQSRAGLNEPKVTTSSYFPLEGKSESSLELPEGGNTPSRINSTYAIKFIKYAKLIDETEN
jgi:hypothetical protein